MTSLTQYDLEMALDLMGRPGDLIRIVPKSDPDNFYNGRILQVLTTGDGQPLAYVILQPQARLQQVVPWDAIESVTFMEFASDADTQTPEDES